MNQTLVLLKKIIELFFPWGPALRNLPAFWKMCLCTHFLSFPFFPKKESELLWITEHVSAVCLWHWCHHGFHGFLWIKWERNRTCGTCCNYISGLASNISPSRIFRVFRSTASDSVQLLSFWTSFTIKISQFAVCVGLKKSRVQVFGVKLAHLMLSDRKEKVFKASLSQLFIL